MDFDFSDYDFSDYSPAELVVIIRDEANGYAVKNEALSALFCKVGRQTAYRMLPEFTQVGV